MKGWKRGMTSEVVSILHETAGESVEKGYSMLEQEAKVITPLSEVRRIARRYSKRYHMPIRIDAERIEEVSSGADALHAYSKRNGKVKSVIYLHPILKYYTPEYIENVIEHEFDHAEVEKKWEKEL